MVAKTLIEALANFDANAVIGKALAASGPKLLKMATNEVRKTPERLSAAFGQGFAHHLQSTFDRCYRIKTLIYREEPVPLLSQYVSIKLGLKSRKINDDTLISRIEDFKNIIVQGSGGSGKTMFMKYLALCRFENPKGRIPVFVEMRSLDFGEKKNIEELVYDYSTPKNSKVSFTQFEAALSSGMFILILDGLDEVEPDHRERVHRQILNLPVKYPENILVVSSREDPSLGGWGPFYLFNVLPLDKRQVTAVVRKIEFDPVIKAKFLKDLASHLYVQHRSFLTNPLLATIMLLRYDQFANSSDKIHIFYDQAFETLFFKHDLSKGVYERKRYTKLTVDEFRAIFAAFCFSTYAKNKFAFSRTEIISYLDKAIKYAGGAPSASAFLKDLIENVCIVQEDGLEFTFVHRSFQEYFAAFFVAEYRGIKVREYVDIIMSRGQTETAGLLLKEMAPSLVERNWTIPVMEQVMDEIGREDVKNNTGLMISLTSGRLYFDRDGKINGFGVSPIGNKLLALNRYNQAGMTSFLNSGLLFDNREELMSLPSKVDPTRKLDAQRIVTMIVENRGGLDVDESDNYWLGHTHAAGFFAVLCDNVKNAYSDLTKRVASYDAADEELI